MCPFCCITSTPISNPNMPSSPSTPPPFDPLTKSQQYPAILRISSTCGSGLDHSSGGAPNGKNILHAHSRDVKINDIVGDGISGVLYKWVNYGKGWRPRWFVLQDEVLSYYKIHGPDKIVVNQDTEKRLKVIGEESIKRISRHDHHYRNGTSGSSENIREPVGEVHLKVSSIRESRSDDKRFSMNNKDGRVKDEGYIYMVLEYGEIDLAHMLSQKWGELDGSIATMDENWLRFYWKQILLAVNTIHEERILHSDLKPANFLLVKGSLKLIDFGIAKAIMSDTTNIQRDSQVGTLSYMSPEAFMCNETDGNGNVIKCGRPSDIWSLGCILYQMVYGRTPFSEYKTFWAKFKVITDPNHNIIYEPLPNPLLLDLMKKCLAWDRNKRWRIPQLLQHPFLVPPIPPQSFNTPDQSCKLLQLISESNLGDEKAPMLCSQLQNMLNNPISFLAYEESVSRGHVHEILGKISTLFFQLQEQFADLERTSNDR